MRQYIGLIHKDADSEYGVSFPDFPGCITAGATLEEARRMAEEALALHVKGLVEDDEAVPEPSTLDDVMRDPEHREGVVVLVPLADQAARTVRVNITLTEGVLKEIDAFAATNGYTRSGFLVMAARRAMAEPGTKGAWLARTVLDPKEQAQRLLLASIFGEDGVPANHPSNPIPPFNLGDLPSVPRLLPDVTRVLRDLEAKIQAMDATMASLRRAATESLAITELRVMHEKAHVDEDDARAEHG